MVTTYKSALQRFHAHCANIEQKTFITPKETALQRRIRMQTLLQDAARFVEYYFPHYTTDEDTGELIPCADFQIAFLNNCLADKNYFGVNEWPREHAKSVHCCVILPLWLWMHKQLDGMILGGSTEEAARKLISDVQAEFVSNHRIIADYGEQKTIGSWEEGNFELRDGTFFTALGRGQSPRGIRKREKRPNLGVIDDIDDDEIVLNQQRVRKTVEWIMSAFYGALKIKQSRFVMAGNRIHKQSILAHIVGDTGPDSIKRHAIAHSRIIAYDNNGIPAWHQRYTLLDIRRRIEKMGTLLGMREYFHEPVTTGTVFKHEWISWGKVPELHTLEASCIYIDPSFKSNAKSDYKAVSHWGVKDQKYYKIKSFCRQSSMTTLVKWCYDYYEQMPSNYAVQFFIEGNFIQNDLLKDFEEEGKLRRYQLPIIADKRQKPDKHIRIVANMQHLYERGMVIYNETEMGNADMLEARNQLLSIEQGSRAPDDAPDADEGALFIITRGAQHKKNPPRIGYYSNNRDF